MESNLVIKLACKFKQFAIVSRMLIIDSLSLHVSFEWNAHYANLVVGWLLSRSKATSISMAVQLPPKIISEYDQEIPQSPTADNPMAPRGRAKFGVNLHLFVTV